MTALSFAEIRAALERHGSGSGRSLGKLEGWDADQVRRAVVAMAGMYHRGILTRDSTSVPFRYALNPAYSPARRGPKMDHVWTPPAVKAVLSPAAAPLTVPALDPYAAAVEALLRQAQALWRRDLKELELRLYAAFGGAPTESDAEAAQTIVKAATGDPTRPRKPKVLIYKLSAAREELIKAEYGDKFDLCIFRDQGRPRAKEAMRAASAKVDLVILTTDICSHTEMHALRDKRVLAGETTAILETGSLGRLREVLNAHLSARAAV